MHSVSMVATVTAEGQIRMTAKGHPVCTVKVVDRYNRGEHTFSLYTAVVGWGTLAEELAELNEGSVIHVIGRIHINKWETKEGKTRYDTQIVADQLHVVKV